MNAQTQEKATLSTLGSGMPSLRVIGLIVLGWLTVNAGLYGLIIENESATVPKIRRPSPLARKLYASLPRQFIGTSNALSEQPSYRLLFPANPKPNEQYPLLIFLHGSGQRGNDNEQQLIGLPEQMIQPSWRQQFPCFLLAPQCPSGTSWGNFEEDLLQVIQNVIRNETIDPKRIYLTGLSMGGFGSWGLAIKQPSLFAAVVPICGGGNVNKAKELIRTPIWAVHGDADPVIPVEQSREMIEAIRQAGGQPKYTELPNVGHDSWSQTYQAPDGVIEWIFSQRLLKAE